MLEFEYVDNKIIEVDSDLYLIQGYSDDSEIQMIREVDNLYLEEKAQLEDYLDKS